MIVCMEMRLRPVPRNLSYVEPPVRIGLTTARFGPALIRACPPPANTHSLRFAALRPTCTHRTERRSGRDPMPAGPARRLAACVDRGYQQVGIVGQTLKRSRAGLAATT